MWLTVDYEPVAAFGLRPSNTTSSGGKSLLVPTPYAIKMALLDVAIRLDGLEQGQALFEAVRDLTIYARVPLAVAVTRTFQKVLRVQTNKKSGEVWNSTIAQREYCIHTGALTLALNPPGELLQDMLRYLVAIRYFGRRGSFVQMVAYDSDVTEPVDDEAYVNLCQQSTEVRLGMMQLMDDMRPDATFADVSTYERKSARADGGRVKAYYVILPYALAHHGHNHTVYERTEATGGMP